MKNIKYICLFFLILAVAACDPSIEDDINLGPLPDPPAFSVEMVPGDSNRVVVRDLSGDSFDRLWTFEGGDPGSSRLVEDTVFFAKAGEHKITLIIAQIGGSGTATSSQTVVIEKDAVVECGEKIALLTGGCGEEGKCWTLSTAAGAISVGPTYGSTEWFSSPEDGLDDSQADDRFCFFFEDRVFHYQNNGTTVSPWDGYVPIPYDPPPVNWSFREGAGVDGVDQIVLPDGYFMGVWDSGPVLDVVTLTETDLVIRAYIVDQDGNQAPEGWFELTFVAL